MLKEIDVFVLFNYGDKITPFLSSTAIELFVKSALKDDTINLDDIKSAMKIQPPKTTQIVQRLHSMGIQPKTIAEWLDINKSSVTYHLQKTDVPEYKNYRLNYFVDKYNQIFVFGNYKHI